MDAVHHFATALENRCARACRSLPAIALFEMRYGFAKSDRRAVNERLLERFLGLGVDVLPFDAEDAAHAGDIRAHLESKGAPIGPYDRLIATQARGRTSKGS